MSLAEFQVSNMSSEIQQRIVELDNGLAESEMQLLAAAERLQALREAKNEKDSDSDDDKSDDPDE